MSIWSPRALSKQKKTLSEVKKDLLQPKKKPFGVERALLEPESVILS